MKKNIFLLGAMALFASCSQNSVEETLESTRQITFSNLNNKITKADTYLFVNPGANENHDDYKVFASTSLDNSKWYFEDNVGGTPSTPNFNVAKNGPYYWLDDKTEFKFYAYAPSTLATTGTVGDLSIDYTVKPEAIEDFTVAKPVTSVYSSSNNGVVNLEFLHMLAKININVVLSGSLEKTGYKVELGTATLKVGSSKGTIKPTAATPAWDGLSTAATYAGRCEYNILPQTSVGCSIQLNGLKITKNGITVYPLDGRSKDLKEFVIEAKNVAGDKFEMGKKYNLTFTIDKTAHDGKEILVFGQEIKFSSNYANWNDVETPLIQK